MANTCFVHGLDSPVRHIHMPACVYVPMYVIGCVCVWQGRALTALAGDTETDTVKFLAGTQSVRNDNQIHEINYDQETDKASTRVFAFPQGQIW